MDINSFKQGPRTAGISIFHDGLPKLASVHCYDRGNVATFSLQTCQPKRPIDTIPIRPIPNHINSKGVLMSHQRLYGDPKRQIINQSKLYSGTFYPPGSQPRLQFVGGTPVILPSTFNNKFISRECFDPSVNKTKSVIYNEPSQYYNCCSQYASDSNVHKCPDDINKKQLPNIIPDLTYNYSYIVNSESVARAKYNIAEYNAAKSDAFRRRIHSDGFNRDAYHQLTSCEPSINPPLHPPPLTKSFQPQPETRCLSYPTSHQPMIVSVESIADNTKVDKIHDSYTNIIDNENEAIMKCRHNNGDITMRSPTSSISPRQKNTTLRCNSCQKDMTCESRHIDNQLSMLLCKECANKNRMWGSMKNLPNEPHRATSDKANTCSCMEADCVYRRYSPTEIPIEKNVDKRTPIVIEIDENGNEDNDDEETFYRVPNSKQASPNGNLDSRKTVGNRIDDCSSRNSSTTSPHRAPRCVKCWEKRQMLNSKHFSPVKVTNGEGTAAKPINLDDDEKTDDDEKMPASENTSNPSPRLIDNTSVNSTPESRYPDKVSKPVIVGEVIKIKEEVVDVVENKNNNNNIIGNIDNNDNKIELDIDVSSFESFINNDVNDNNNSNIYSKKPYSNAINVSSVDDNINVDRPKEDGVYVCSNKTNGDVVLEKKDEEEINKDHFESCFDMNTLDAVTRKRKLNCPSLPNLECRDSSYVPSTPRGTKSYPTSPNLLIDEAQLQMLRNKVVPVLKAKKWIRENSVESS